MRPAAGSLELAMSHALISLGSNLGDRCGLLKFALQELAAVEGVELLRRSQWYRSPPIGGPAGQGEFLNGTAVVETSLPPLESLEVCQQIEQRAARRQDRRWSARTLDLDLLLFDEQQCDSQRLTLPHPRMTCRRFVLAPAAEIAPAMVHPGSGWAVAALARQLAGGGVAVAGEDKAACREVIAEVLQRLATTWPAFAAIEIAPWSTWGAANFFPPELALLLAVWPSDCTAEQSARQRLNLPASGPVTWLGREAELSLADEAAAAIAAAFAPLS